MATSGDAFQARGKARTAGLANDIRYALPKEGTVVWYDFLAIPKNAANANNALRLIDYMLRPEVAARLTNAKGFGNAVMGAALYVKPEIKTDAALSPDLATLPNVIEELSPSPAAVALRNRFWQLINSPEGSAKAPAP
jgi:putrescine transport system substrate-binding protein